MRAHLPSGSGGVGVFLTLLALLVRLAVPQGTMVAAEPLGPTLVICTGHGPMSAPDQPIPARANSGDCAFAAHVGAAPVFDAPALMDARFIWGAAANPLAPSATGESIPLAAPPPPPLGPPPVES